MKKPFVLGIGIFIRRHLVKRHERDGFCIKGVDVKLHDYVESQVNDFVGHGLREQSLFWVVVDGY